MTPTASVAVGRHVNAIRLYLLTSARIACAVGWLTSASSVGAESKQFQQIWEIGRRDNSTQEFRSDWSFSQGLDPIFVVGGSKPKRDWSGFHPGPLNSAHSKRLHPFTIIFQLDRAPQGTFYLHVDAMFKAFLLSEDGAQPPQSLRVPGYLVEINGRRGKFYFHPQLSHAIGDWQEATDILFSTARLEIALPASYFRQGKNQLVLTCLDEEEITHGPHVDTGSAAAGIYYDSLDLKNDPDAQFDQTEVHAEAMPTIFYRSDDANRLSELVTIEARVASRLHNGSASLFMRDRRYTCQLASTYDFGESQCTLEVSEFEPTTRARLAVDGAGRTRSYQVSLTPQKKFNLFLIPQIHFDPGYTDYRPNSYEVYSRSLDSVIQELEAHPDYKFTPDGSWVLEDYLAHRGGEWQKRAISLLRSHRLDVVAQLFNVDTELMSQEEMNHLGYSSQELYRRYGITYENANLCDVPAATWSLPSYLQSIGVKYLVVGSDPWRAPILFYGQLDQRSPFWWEGPDGSKVLTWYARIYGQMMTLFGAPVSVATGVNNLPIFLQSYASTSYASDAVLIYGTQGDNAPFDARLIEIADTWNKEFAYPKFTVANMDQFFRYVENKSGKSLQILRGDGGASWGEMAVSDARYTGIARQAKARAVTAETLASLGVIANHDFRYPLAIDHEVWSNLLQYSEHVWGYSQEWVHPESDLSRNLLQAKESFGIDAKRGVEDLLRRGFDQLKSRIDTQSDSVVVFNPLSWRRSGLVEIDLPRGLGLKDLKTQQPVRLELLRRVEEEDYDRVRFWAEEIPAVGYRSYEVIGTSTAAPAEDLPIAKNGSIENDFYRIAVDETHGGISSIYDKTLDLELVDQGSSYALDQYVYAGYGHDEETLISQRKLFNSTLLKYSNSLPHPDLRVEKAGEVRIASAKKTPWGVVLLLKSRAAHTKNITTEIRLFNREKRIVFINTIDKDVVHAPEGVYFAFPLASRLPTIRYDIQNGWVDPMRDQLPGANKEWFAAQNWIAAGDSGGTVGLALTESPFFTIGDIVHGSWPTTLEVNNGTLFSYVMNNYDGDDERPFQGGELTFRYVLESYRQFNSTAMTRFGLETNQPLEVDGSPLSRIRLATPREPLPRSEESFLDIEDPVVILSAWKGAEDGDGYILRFYNTSEKMVTTHIWFPNLQFDGLVHTSPVEADLDVIQSQQGRLEATLKPHEIYSLRVKGFRLNGQLRNQEK